MIKLEKTEVYGWEAAVRGMRNPMNSWKRSYSGYYPLDICYNDLNLMQKLAVGGPVHAKYRRMITVYVDITAPLYWWKEFDTYKVGTVANSCSTMHKIMDKKFELGDFSCEYLMSVSERPIKSDESAYDLLDVVASFVEYDYIDTLNLIIIALNEARNRYLECEKNDPEAAKLFWWQIIQLLPSSYNQKRTIMLNYEVLTGIFHSRKDHKLDEWHNFCDWIRDLPYSEIITGEKYDD